MDYIDFDDSVLERDLGFSKERIDKINSNVEKKLESYDRLRRSISKELLIYKEVNNLSLNDIREGLNTSRSQVQRILSGTSNFTLETILNISEFIGKDAYVVWK